MGELSAAMLAEARNPYGNLFACLSIDAPDGNEYRFASEGAASAARGQFQGRVLVWDEVSETWDLQGYQLAAVGLQIEIADHDKMWSKLHASYQNTLPGSVATVRLLSRAVPDADSFVAFCGILRSYTMLESGAWQLSLEVDDYALRNNTVPQDRIIEPDFPDAHESALNEVAPIFFGEHDSAGLTDEGMVPTLYVDTTGFRYAVSMGYLASVPVVYKDGVEVSSGYEITHPVINGTQWTLIDFTADQGDDASITCDLQGLTEEPDGTGDLIENPVTQMQRFLTWYVFNKYGSGAYPTTTRIDATSWAAVAAIMENRVPGGSLRIGMNGAEKPADILNAWAAEFGLYPYWKFNGTLGLGTLPWEPSTDYPSQVILEPDQKRPISLPVDGSQKVRVVDHEYLYNEAEGKFHRTRHAMDPSVLEEVTRSRQARHSRSKLSTD